MKAGAHRESYMKVGHWNNATTSLEALLRLPEGREYILPQGFRGTYSGEPFISNFKPPEW